ncbi:MAG: hypothetical protein ACI4MU_07185, partial [Candidatus Ventricola sp.]
DSPLSPKAVYGGESAERLLSPDGEPAQKSIRTESKTGTGLCASLNSAQPTRLGRRLLRSLL